MALYCIALHCIACRPPARPPARPRRRRRRLRRRSRAEAQAGNDLPHAVTATATEDAQALPLPRARPSGV